MAANQSMVSALRGHGGDQNTRRRWIYAAVGVIGILGIAAAGVTGYHRYGSSAPLEVSGGAGLIAATAQSEGRASAPRSTAVGNGSGTPASRMPPLAREAGAAVQRPGNPASGAALRWPVWEFQLRQPIPPRDPPLTPPPWRLVGATASSGAWQLIILRQGKTAPEFYSTGDSLPGGYVVGTITEEDVTLIHGKRAVLLSYIGIR